MAIGCVASGATATSSATPERMPRDELWGSDSTHQLSMQPCQRIHCFSLAQQVDRSRSPHRSERASPLWITHQIHPERVHRACEWTSSRIRRACISHRCGRGGAPTVPGSARHTTALDHRLDRPCQLSLPASRNLHLFVPARFHPTPLVQASPSALTRISCLLIPSGIMAFALPPLPYAYDALEPYIDSTTVCFLVSS